MRCLSHFIRIHTQVQKRGAKDTEHKGMEWYAASNATRERNPHAHRDSLLVHYKSVEKDKEHFVKFGHPIVHTNA